VQSREAEQASACMGHRQDESQGDHASKAETLANNKAEAAEMILFFFSFSPLLAL